jgi:hypothetical protein
VAEGAQIKIAKLIMKSKIRFAIAQLSLSKWRKKNYRLSDL